MCTIFTLHYKCTHTQTSHRCPRSTFTYKSVNGGTATYTKDCGNKTYVDGQIDENCINCKIASGLVPGLQTGLDVWATDSKGLKMEDAGGSGVEESYSLDEHETLEAPVEERLREALGKRDAHGQGDVQKRQPSGPLKAENEDEEWMWGGMNGFGGEQAERGA